MNMRAVGIWVVVVWVSGAPVVSLHGQGSLTPPGVPAPTMKTLSQVEPRIPISTPWYAISQPGSYYLTTNLTSTGHGVLISTDDVTLDLMGFTLRGAEGSSGGSGVSIQTGVQRVTIRNGVIRDFSWGVRTSAASACRLEKLTVCDNGSQGIYFYSYGEPYYANTVTDCIVADNGGSGISFSGSGAVSDNVVERCVVRGNAGSGIHLAGAASGAPCSGNRISHCVVSGNSSYGIMLFGNFSARCLGNQIEDCVISGGGNYGISMQGYEGECSGNVIRGCMVYGNTERGIVLSWPGTTNNRLENNHVTGQVGDGSTYGIMTSSGSGNVIVGNTCAGHTNNYSISGSDTYGPIVTTSGALGTTGADAHPWANFSR